jgi:uncharacterized membrane protein
MADSSKKNRIIFIDLLRAFAVLQMVQGHTTDVLLAGNVRDFNDPLYYLWHFMRGMTAPIFLFTAGTVFTYLFRLSNEPFRTNNRVKKGFQRAGLLLFIGYFLRYPTPTILDFSSVSAASWKIFFAVDVLHLIAISLVLVMMLSWLAEKSKLPDIIVYSAGVLFFFMLYPVVYQVRWGDFLHPFIAGYLYTGTGSQFPLFPWAGYLISGAILGSYLARYPVAFKSAKFSKFLAGAGIGFILISIIGDILESNYFSGAGWYNTYSIVSFRIGFVLLLVSVVSYVSISVEYIPRVVILLGRNTLLIYVTHLILLYGSAWNPGLNRLYERTFSGWSTLLAALGMITLMTGMVLLINKLKIKNKELVT